MRSNPTCDRCGKTMPHERELDICRRCDEELEAQCGGGEGDRGMTKAGKESVEGLCEALAFSRIQKLIDREERAKAREAATGSQGWVLLERTRHEIKAGVDACRE